MARMIPDDRVPGEFKNSYGEEILYYLLRDKLGPEYIVIHGMLWERRKSDKELSREGQYGFDESDADVIIFHPRRGLLAIEVKGGKGSGDVSYRNNRWFYSSGVEMKKGGPMRQAKRSKQAIIDELPDWLFPVEAAVWFPLAKQVQGEHPPGLQKQQILLAQHLENPQRAIEDVFDFYRMYDTPHPQEDRITVLTALAPLFRLVITQRDKHEAHEHRFLRLTRQQFYLLDYLEEQRVAAIQGGAGTGKTLLAEEKVRRLSETGKVLFLCFNTFLRDELRRRNHDLFISGNVEIHSIDSLATAYSNNTIVVENDRQQTDKNISDYLVDCETNWNFQHVVIDEGQDIHWEHIWRLYDITKERDGAFYVFYDRNQRVQQKDGLIWLDLMECRLVLSKNCRNTQSIAFTSYRPVQTNRDAGKHTLEMEEEIPRLWIVDSLEQAREKVAERVRHYIQNEKLRSDEIVILTTKGKDGSKVLCNVARIGAFDLTDKPGTPGILFTSARMFKGLEASAVIIIDVDESSFSKDPHSEHGENEPSEAAKLLYVAASRAKTSLDLVAAVDTDQLKAITVQLTGTEKKRPKKTIETELGVQVL